MTTQDRLGHPLNEGDFVLYFNPLYETEDFCKIVKIEERTDGKHQLYLLDTGNLLNPHIYERRFVVLPQCVTYFEG